MNQKRQRTMRQINRLGGAALVALFLMSAGAVQAAPVSVPNKLKDPESHGSRMCSGAVRNTVERCNTWGYLPEDVERYFSLNDRENCRAECTECCDTLPQYGDTTALIQGMNELCGCTAGLLGTGTQVGAAPGVLICLAHKLYQNPELASVLFGIGLLDGNGFEAPPEPAGGTVTDGEITGMFGPSLWEGTPLWDLTPEEVSEQYAFIGFLYEKCDEATISLVDQAVQFCHEDCAVRFPTGDAPPNPVPNNPEGENEGGGGGQGPDGPDGPGGPGGPDGGDGENPFEQCQFMVGDRCFGAGGEEGTMNEYCECEVVWVEEGCPPGHQDVCGNQTGNCWLCDEQDPPPWCDFTCWGF
ncbi:MAG: hypothetical protein AAF560_16940 [Acidobacteriota bacterium]